MGVWYNVSISSYGKGGLAMNRILVCITIQENSKRLIHKGFELTQSIGGELHVLHIRKGETIFDNPNSTNLFEELFVYGSELGGEVHFLCSNDVIGTISDFISHNQISHVVVGKPPESVAALTNIYAELESKLQDTKLIVVDRHDI